MSGRGGCLAVGLISGTSMDGIDAALVRIGGDPERPRVRLRSFQTVPYPGSLRRELLHIASGGATSAGAISTLNFVLGGLFADAALAVCRKGRVPPGKLAVIGSHGQTIFHHGPGPRENSSAGVSPTHGRLGASRYSRVRAPDCASTFQIAEPAVIAERLGAPVVADFRAADLAAGGQGAPLVPMLDYLLLRDPAQGTAALNLGGIANLTIIPAAAKPADVFGFDTGPGNMLIDGLVRHFSRGRRTFDAGGKRAARGTVIRPLLERMLRQPFFAQPPPKSAGREQFGDEFLNSHFLKRDAAPPADLLRTATELTAASVGDAIERFVLPRVRIQRLIISGGGAHNALLMRRIAELLPGISVQLSERFGLPGDAKEAIAFAVLADRSRQGLPGNLPGVTGARHAVTLGKLLVP
ncbi:MAG: anhydro-N-acetylmuramic acid kinase [Terriglobia bacterium]